jgi:hypothetical protein
LFGSDVHFTEIEKNISIYEEIAGNAGWNVEMKENMFYYNSIKLFKKDNI